MLNRREVQWWRTIGRHYEAGIGATGLCVAVRTLKATRPMKHQMLARLVDVFDQPGWLLMWPMHDASSRIIACELLAQLASAGE